MRDLARVFFGRRSYSFVIFAMFLTGVGSGLTQAAVFSRLSEIGAKPFYFALAFSLATIPALFSTYLSSWLSKRFSPKNIMAAFQLLGAMCLAFPFFGFASNSIFLLLVAEFVTAVISGISFPFLKLLVKESFQDADLPIAARVDTFVFILNVVLGTVLGSVLLSVVSYKVYLSIDFMSYFLSMMLILLSGWKPLSQANLRSAGNSGFSLWRLNGVRRRAFLVMPLLTLVGTTPVALLPSLNAKIGASVSILNMVVASSMFLIMAKSLGQMVGSLLLPKLSFEKMSKSNGLLFSCLLGFVCIYLAIPQITLPGVMFATIVFAHTLSNVVYVLGFYLLQKHFSQEEIVSAAGAQYRWQMAIISIQALLAGALASVIGQTLTILILSGFGLAALAFVLFGISHKADECYE